MADPNITTTCTGCKSGCGCTNMVETSNCYCQSCSSNSGSVSDDMSKYVSLTGSGGCSIMTVITNGLSAYQLEVLAGYKGTQEEWLASLSNGVSVSGTFVPVIMAGPTALPISSYSAIYNKAYGVVNWNMTFQVSQPVTPPSGNITITGLPFLDQLAAGSFGVSVEGVSGASTYISFILTNTGIAAFKDNIGNVTPSGGLTPLTYEDLSFPLSITISGSYILNTGVQS